MMQRERGVCCNVMQRVAVSCSSLQCEDRGVRGQGHDGAAERNVLQCVAMCCSVLRCDAVRCSVKTEVCEGKDMMERERSGLQCVAVC